MDFEAWWILIPLSCFALGWFAARVDIRYVLRDARALPAAYFRGLNYLLREQHDKAVESFVDVSRRDPHALDLELALGSLFRRQGRIGDATTIHQALADRHDLPKEKRELALFELAQDFHAAGLFDRAETVYRELSGTAYEAEAAAKLASVLEQEKEWAQAIEARERIQSLHGEPQGRFISQYHCELADLALATGNDAQVQSELAKAATFNRNNGRIHLITFNAAYKRHDYAAAEVALQALKQSRPDLLTLIADDVVSLYENLGRTQIGIEQLAAAQNESPSALGLTKLIDASLRIEGHDSALSRLRKELTQQPSVRETARVLELESKQFACTTATEAAAQSMGNIAALLYRASPKIPGFQCGHCGFKAPRYYWKCPGCNHWDSFRASQSDA